MLSGSDVAALVAAQAEAVEATILSVSGAVVLAVVHIRRPSGKVISYALRIETHLPEPKVREAVRQLLPDFCPDRHINVGGYFCMSFPAEEPLPVFDAASAEAWWRRLWKFLSLQETTRRLKRWPTTHEWAHGQAAVHQGAAERSAADLGPRIKSALDRRSLWVKRRVRASVFLELWDDQGRIYSVWEHERRVATLRQACLCGSGLPLRACSFHAAIAAELPFELLAWRKTEAEFWSLARDRDCCGDLAECPLRVSQPAPASPSPPLANAA